MNPYEPPRSEGERPRDELPRPRAYLGRVARAAVLTVVVGQVAELGLGHAAARRLVPLSVASGALLVVALAFWVAAALVLVWLFHAVRNVHALGARAFPFTPGTAVLWWFIPFANLVQIPRIVSATWRASNGSSAWRENETTPLVAIWWGSHLASRLLGLLAYRAHSDSVAVPAVITLLSAVAGVSLASILDGIDAKQASAAARFERMV